jgi:hypothetical protein
VAVKQKFTRMPKTEGIMEAVVPAYTIGTLCVRASKNVAVARSDRLRLVVECGTSYGYCEEVRAVTIIPEGSQSQPGTPQVLDRGYAGLRRTPFWRSSQNSPSTPFGE